MTTQQKKNRQVRAIDLVNRRIDFWTNNQDLTEHEGKPCNPEQKLAIAQNELASLQRKTVFA